MRRHQARMAASGMPDRSVHTHYSQLYEERRRSFVWREPGHQLWEVSGGSTTGGEPVLGREGGTDCCCGRHDDALMMWRLCAANELFGNGARPGATSSVRRRASTTTSVPLHDRGRLAPPVVDPPDTSQSGWPGSAPDETSGAFLRRALAIVCVHHYGLHPAGAMRACGVS